ncbi:MAG TPA: phenylalanine--tRNA ligase subunit beta [Candidatus Dormibacteraeota bacterium]|nr:phenylalanine--tRNA ligase subunit beta [Candidatus Dormibacteraeota bacterium]
MKVLSNWLKEFVSFTAPPEDLASRLSLAGVNIGAVEDSQAGPVLDADLTTNRPDCLGHYGIAREVAALYRLPLKNVTPQLTESSEKASDAVRVTIESPDLCGRFTARVIRGVRVQPSPAWLRERLEALGQTSINNIVDATNYVMIELGHPLHAFDYDRISGHHIIVRRSRPSDPGQSSRPTGGDTLQTLDGVERAIPSDVCLVCDAVRPVGIGGIMGGSATEISFATKNVLLECAWFDPISIRRAAKNLKLHTEASTRFGRGADPEMADLASRRCAELIQQLAGGEIPSGVVDQYPRRLSPAKLTLRRAELLRVMGADIPDKEVEAILKALGFAPVRNDATRGQSGSLMAAWECTTPSWRSSDVTRSIDLIEEVARLYGLDKFPARMPSAHQAAARLPYAEADDRLRERLIGLGYREIISITHVDPSRDELFRPDGVTPARLANPIAEDASVLRSTGIVSMVAALEWNLNHGQRNARLFEFGRGYRLDGTDPVETRILTIGATGDAQEKSIYQEQRDYSFADLKGDLDALGELAGGFAWQPTEANWLHRGRSGHFHILNSQDVNTFPSAGSRAGGSSPGIAGQLAKSVCERLKIRQDVFLAELALDDFYQHYTKTKQQRRYQPLPRYPAVERDFSLLLPEGTSFADVARVIRQTGIEELSSIEAVDLFRGKTVPAGKYSLLVRVRLHSREGTFTEAQLTEFTSGIVAALARQLGATLRAS